MFWWIIQIGTWKIFKAWKLIKWIRARGRWEQTESNFNRRKLCLFYLDEYLINIILKIWKSLEILATKKLSTFKLFVFIRLQDPFSAPKPHSMESFLHHGVFPLRTGIRGHCVYKKYKWRKWPTYPKVLDKGGSLQFLAHLLIIKFLHKSHHEGEFSKLLVLIRPIIILIYVHPPQNTHHIQSFLN